MNAAARLPPEIASTTGPWNVINDPNHVSFLGPQGYGRLNKSKWREAPSEEGFRGVFDKRFGVTISEQTTEGWPPRIEIHAGYLREDYERKQEAKSHERYCLDHQIDTINDKLGLPRQFFNTEAPATAVASETILASQKILGGALRAGLCLDQPQYSTTGLSDAELRTLREELLAKREPIAQEAWKLLHSSFAITDKSRYPNISPFESYRTPTLVGTIENKLEAMINRYQEYLQANADTRIEPQSFRFVQSCLNTGVASITDAFRPIALRFSRQSVGHRSVQVRRRGVEP